MDSSQGLLVIYLIDLYRVFNVKNNGENSSLTHYALDKGLDESFQKQTPLIGYALGFPTNVGVNGADYVTQHLFKEPKEMSLDELKVFIKERDFDIDLDGINWLKEDLLEAILDNPLSDESDILDDGVETDEVIF